MLTCYYSHKLFNRIFEVCFVPLDQPTSITHVARGLQRNRGLESFSLYMSGYWAERNKNVFEQILTSVRHNSTLEHLEFNTGLNDIVVDCTDREGIARFGENDDDSDDDSEGEDPGSRRRRRVLLSQSILYMLKVNKTIHRLDIPAHIIDMEIIQKKVLPLLKVKKLCPRIGALREESNEGLQTKLLGRILTHQGEIARQPSRCTFWFRRLVNDFAKCWGEEREGSARKEEEKAREKRMAVQWRFPVV